ncbi:hypothetical protein BE21_58020 [Sorangium cellulosum]|uniref:Cytochrome c domain-containing protein n=1 Tax=Sorangium cellulosum TaxID=56 RepID=A0A150U2N6_SORCE|nr:hypothetical protein BE21_58020 [Sorangium cellulosum]
MPTDDDRMIPSSMSPLTLRQYEQVSRTLIDSSPPQPGEIDVAPRGAGKYGAWIRQLVTGAAGWLSTSRAAFCIPLVTFLVLLTVLVFRPGQLDATVAVDLRLPSEEAIPKEQLAPGVEEIDPEDIVWRFRYGATGTEFGGGVPYWIFRVMPKIFDDEFKGRGYDRFGFGADDAGYYASRPVGRGLFLADSTLNIPLLRTRFALKRVAINCSGCHRGEYLNERGEPVYVDGMPNHTADLQGFKRFFARAFQDERMTGDRLIQEIDAALAEEGAAPLTAREQAIYRILLVELKKRGSAGAFDWMDLRADNGPGRIDPFNAVKFEVLKAPDDGTAAQIDFPSLWNQRAEIRAWHHVDGNTMSSKARNRGSAIGVGAVPMSLNKATIDAIGRWLDRDLPAPKYPFTAPATERVERGLAVFTEHCASCHGLYDPEKRTIEEVEGSLYMERVDTGTDAERSKAFMKPAADALNAYGERRLLWEKDAFRPVREAGEYLAGPLDGIWARAPYLHNGSVPTLADLLKPPAPRGKLAPEKAREFRPKQFYRGDRRFDERNVGWVSTEPMEGERALFLYRTVDDNGKPIPGNGNEGHTYGTGLPPEDREALIDYLKTL